MASTTLDTQSDRCPVCLNDKYLNQAMKLLVSPCYHKMCEACVSRIFNAGPAPCPICSTTLRKQNFIQQTFDDLYVEKEIQIRKKVGKFFNKRQEDFNSLREYNDYLEEAEDMMFNMINNVNVQETEDKIEKFRLENKDIISKNMQKQAMEEKALMKELNREKKEKQLKREAYEKRALEETLLKRKEAENLINQLAASKTSTKLDEIIQSNRQKKKKTAGGGSGAGGFQKIKLVHVNVNDDGGDDEAMDVESEADFNPLEGIALKEKLLIQQSDNFLYSCSWSAPLVKDAGEVLLKAEGYSINFTYARALRSASSELLVNIET